ncbi:Ku protein, partial [cyanobacterium TDX16]
MPRAIWSGSISFGLVNIPVKLYNAVSRKSVHFNQLDAKTGARVKRKWISAADGRDLENDEIIRGYELPSGEYVTVDDDEIAALDPVAVRTIDIEEFVDLDQIDPIFYDSAYYLAPDKATTKPYALLAQAMEESGKIGVARFVMRSKQYLAAVRPKDGRLLLSTMVYADEVNDPADVPELEGVEDVDLPEKELQMAVQLVESLSGDFVADQYEDTYRTQVLDLIERKAAGEDDVVAAPEEPEPSKVIDLMAALEKSVADAKAARGRHPAGNTDEGEVTTKPAKKKAAAKKAGGAKKAAKKAPAKKAAA